MSNEIMPPHGNRKYPWELWSNGQTYVVTRGVHFIITPDSFRRGLCVRAAEMGKKPVTRVVGNVVTFRFDPLPAEAEASST